MEKEVLGRSHIIPARDVDATVLVRWVHATRLLMVSPHLDQRLHQQVAARPPAPGVDGGRRPARRHRAALAVPPRLE